MFTRRCRSRQYRRSRSTETMAVTSGSTALSRATRSSSAALPSSREDRPHPLLAEFLDHGRRFRFQPRFVRREARADRPPPVVRQRIRAAQDRQDDLHREPPHRVGVHGVQPVRQGQRFPRRRHRERKPGHRLRVPPQRRRGQLLIVGFRGAEQRRRPAVVRRQPASLEIILDLGLQGAEEFVPRRRVGAERMGLRLPDRFPPVRDRLRLRVEPLDRLGRHPRLAAAVVLPAQGPDDVLDHRGQRRVLRRLRRHDPVSVEPRLGEDPRRVARVVESDLRRLGLPEDREHQLRPRQHRLPLVASRRRWPRAAGGPSDARDGPGPSGPSPPTGRRRESRAPGCGRPRRRRRTRGSSRRTRSRTPDRKAPPRVSGPATRAT